MWIIPKSLASSFAPDTAAFVSDLSEQSRLCASSLLVRSKPSPLRIWLLKWKRDSWTAHLSGRILRPSLTERFEAAYISSLPDIPASRFQAPESDRVPTIPATCGRSLQLELPLCGHDSVSLRTSKGTYPSDSAKSLKNWKGWVIALRRAYSARLNVARPTSAKESSSWPTAQTADGGKIGNQANYGQVCLSNHPSIVGLPTRAPLEKFGRPAPASRNSDGSRRESWATPQASEAEMAEAGRTVKLRYQVEGAKIGRPTTAKLNPRWVEMLMGLPLGWTAPSAPASLIRNWQRFLDGWR